MKRKFRIEVLCDVEIDDEVIRSVDDAWRRQFYLLMTPADVAEHIAFNLLVNDARLSQLDGFADKPDEMARVLRDTVDVTAEEI